MPIPDWNKQLYLDPRFLPSEADKKTYSYQREIQVEGRKIYACLKPASTLPNCLAPWRNEKLNRADFYFPGGCRSQHQCCSRHPPGSQHTAPLCFYMEMTARFPSAIYCNADILCFYSSLPSLGSDCLGNPTVLSAKPKRCSRGENNLYSERPTRAHFYSDGILRGFQPHLLPPVQNYSPSSYSDSAGSDFMRPTLTAWDLLSFSRTVSQICFGQLNRHNWDG